MSSGAWIRTGADAVTAVAAIAGAGVGGVWAYFRYRREEPDQPRLNVSVAAKLTERGDSHYLAVDLEIRHVAGGILKIEHGDEYDPGHPTLAIVVIEARAEGDVTSQPQSVAELEAFTHQTELGSGEAITDHKIIAVGPLLPSAIGLEASLSFTGTWGSKSWTWSANAAVLKPGHATSEGEGATITRGTSRT